MKWYADVINYLEQTEFPIVKSSRKKDGSFYNVPVSFDIETTSFKNEKGQYCGIMYVWQFAIYNEVFYGRTMEQYQEFCQILTDFLQLGVKAKLIVYVHNLAFEFQFIRKYFKWERVFADKKREPMYADTGTIMYKCSYRLSGYSLAKLAENLQRHKIKKLVGDLDYSLLRHSKTQLTEEELGYCANDVLIVTAYIAEQIEDNGDITKIPLTSTGFVRRHIYEQTVASPNRIVGINYRGLMKTLTINEDVRWNPKKNNGKGAYENKEYQALKMAFQGGFTHASAIHSGVIEENVSSYDFTSSYPAVMLSEEFPMSKAEVKVPSSQLEFETMLKCYCVNFSIILKNVKAKFPFEHYISESRCYPPVDKDGNIIKEVDMNIVSENGRVVSADWISLQITELDWDIIKTTYEFEIDAIGTCYCYKKGYLPKPFIEAILELYEKKNLLKGVKGKEVEYLKSKGMLNSCYGMSVTDIVKDSFIYDDEWDCEFIDEPTAISKYNKSHKRFLFYPWGVWITAYARRNLWTGILECCRDYIYSDTDSVKILNKDKHKEYFEYYNKAIENKLYRMCEHYGIDKSKVSPKGKMLGVWDYEGDYKRFKTLGAKRYMVEEGTGRITFTVSGCNKKCAIPYMLEKYGKERIFDEFKNSLYIDGEHTGKLTHRYIDEERFGSLVDYTGLKGYYNQLSGINLAPADFTLSQTANYILYLAGLQTDGGRMEIGGQHEWRLNSTL